MCDKENPNKQGEREGNFEDDAVGEWKGLEDMCTTMETTEDKVCKFFLPHCSLSFMIFVLSLSSPLPFYILFFFHI